MATYENGEICFHADTSGTYVFDVTAEAECGSASCQLTFVVSVDETLDIVCPGDTSVFICEPDTLCFEVDGIPATATVTVTVDPVADIVADSDSTNEDTPVVIDVLDNDTFQGDYGTDYTVTAATDPANGSVNIETDGTITYTPDSNFNGTDTFDYTVTVTNADGSTTTETAMVTVVVNQIDDPATVTDQAGSTSGSGNEDTTISGTLLVSDAADGLIDGTVFTGAFPIGAVDNDRC